MKRYLACIALMISYVANAAEASWYFTQWIMTSGVKVTDCEKVQGGYGVFVKDLETKMRSMGMDQCLESNAQGLKTNILICPDPTHNGNAVSGFWFKDKGACDKKANELRSK